MNHSSTAVDTAVDTTPTWSPDGAEIAFLSLVGGSGIHVMNADGTDRRHVASEGISRRSRPVWSPLLPGPSMTLRSHWVFDPAPGGDRSGSANPGERVQAKVRLRNAGPVAARNVHVSLTVADPDITIVDGEVMHASWPSGEARNNDGFTLDVAPGATQHEVAVTVDVTAANGGPWQFTLSIPVVYPPVFFEHRNHWVFDPTPGGNKDGAANPGERLDLRLRLRNAGTEAAQNARVRLSVNDPAVTVVEGEVAHGTWPGGEARNNVGLALDIAPDAAPHDVTVTADVTADSGGPWQFTFTIPIADLVPHISYRNGWVFDPDGDHDGVADTGERVQPRIRLRNDGPGVARNVRVALAVQDADVAIATGEVVHAAWSVGAARNNNGLALDISPDAASHEVSVTIHVTADNGGPWEFTFTFPVVAPALTFTKRNAWLFEPTASTRDGRADAGERVHPRVRLKNEGPEDAQNVTVTITTDDPDVTSRMPHGRPV